MRQLQLWLDEPRYAGTELVWVVRGALRPERETDLACAALPGLLRSARNEHPERSLRLIDVGHGELSEQALLGALALSAEPELILRGSTLQAPRLAKARGLATQPASVFSPSGTVVITGGTGELGRSLSEHLIRAHGVRHLVLTSRRGGADLPAEFLSELEAAGAESVRVVACDVSKRADVARVLSETPSEHPLTGVFHLAGVLDDGLLSSQTPARLRAVMAPKVDGAWNLHELTRAENLSAFVMFSGLAGTLGAPGQSNYAAANTFMDGLAEARRAQGLVGTSLAWGLWRQSSGGMAAGLGDADLARMSRNGVGALSLADGLALLDAALSTRTSCFVPARLNLVQMQRSLEGGDAPALLSSLLPRKAPRASSARVGQALLELLSGLSVAERQTRVREVVRGEVAAVLGVKEARSLNASKGFTELGFDSLMALELSRRIQQRTGVTTPKTLSFDHPNVDSVCQWLLSELEPQVLESARVAPQRAASVEDAIAIVGVGMRLPGGANDLESFWRMLEEGRDALQEVPRERFDLSAHYNANPDAEEGSYVRSASLVSDVEGFDASFFGISPREAGPMDPQHRLVLEASWSALEHAGFRVAELRDSDTGVFIGAAPGEYGVRMGERADAYGMTGSVPSFHAGRVSYHLGLQGPALTVDTACSSSLVALQLACSALRRGECTVALAAGVQVMANAEAFVALSRTHALSPEGRSKPFSSEADGYGRGEGVGVLALMRLSEAQAGGHPVLAVVRGVAVNHDGASSGITAPNGSSQQKVLRAALRDAGLSAVDVDYVECHGTGTVLGDPIEVQALGAVYGRGRTAESPLQLGAVKSNVGHLEAASGMAGVLKVLASFRHDALPASLNSQPLNPHIAWDELGVEVVTSLRAWPRGERVRRAGVSSFGISGTNAHVILEEPPVLPVVSAEEAVVGTQSLPLLLSGKDESAVRAQAGRWATWLTERPEASLLDVVSTAGLRRSQFESRASLVVENVQDAVAGLRALSLGQSHAGLVEGAASEDGRVGVLFTGQGSQRAGMGRELYGKCSEFRAALDEMATAMSGHLEHALLSVMFAEEGSAESALLDWTEYTQPALFALEVALYRQWSAWGLQPAAVAGHSIGELSAVHVAGVLSLADAAKLVCARGRLMQACQSDGAMVSLEATEAEVLETFARLGATEVDIAGLNGPRQTVISGDETTVLVIAEEFAQQGRRARRLNVSHAFHSPHMDAMLSAYEQVAQSCVFAAPKLTVVSLLTGRQVSGEELSSPSYWVRQVREAVRFTDGVETLSGLTERAARVRPRRGAERTRSRLRA